MSKKITLGSKVRVLKGPKRGLIGTVIMLNRANQYYEARALVRFPQSGIAQTYALHILEVVSDG